MPCFIPSKDRPAQLHLLLESIRRNCPNDLFDKITILYKSTGFEYEEGYGLVKQRFRDLPLIWQRDSGDFYQDLLSHLEASQFDLFTLICDDCVLFRKIPDNSRELIQATMSLANINQFSLRLGYNCTLQYYATGQRQPTLKNYQCILSGSITSDKVISWQFKLRNEILNYGYGFSCDGHVYRTKDLLYLTKKYKVDCLRSLEGVIAGNIRKEQLGDYMASFFQSCLYSIVANNVQYPPLVAGLRHPYSPAALNEKYLDGFVIDYDCIQKDDVDYCHNEFPLTFVEYRG
jgi:hypothetical protein